MTAEKFQIKIPDEALLDLDNRLKRTKWPDEIPGSGWDFGTDLLQLKTLVYYWKNEYNWRKQETELNRLSHFKAEISDMAIHFVHERGKGPNPFPLILTHGFPDSFLRFQKIIPLLSDPEAHGADPSDSFDIVVPSIPGYGFSDVPNKAGSLFRINDLWAELMTNILGYKRFGAHGGDWGGLITEHLARNHSDHVVGIHLTDINFIHTFQKQDDLSTEEEKYLADIKKWQETEGAYAMIQATRPQTLAAGLNDSPAALAAWFIEKFQSMSDCQEDLFKCYSKDELINNIMIYWLTEKICSSFHPYYDVMNAGAFTWIGEKIKEWKGSDRVPAAFCFFARENSHPPREWAERFFNVQQWTNTKHGGHFTAMEEPEILAEDIRKFFRAYR